MEFSFYLEIPDKYVNLDIANNYRQETKRINENLYFVKLKNYPKEIFDTLGQIINKDLNWPKFLENIRDSIETYEDLFLIVKDYINWKIQNEYKKVNTPFAYFYGEKWSGGCNTYNGILKEILDSMGFETRLVAGLILFTNTLPCKDKLRVSARHVWIEVKIDNLWIELDATGEMHNVLPHPLTIRLFDIKRKLKFELDELYKRKFVTYIY